MTVYQWLCLLGIPSLCALIVGAAAKRFQRKLEDQKKETEAVRDGIQALLRAEMISSYNHYMNKGYAPIYAKENFEHLYRSYKDLNGNGVIEDIYRRFMNFETEAENVQ